MLRRTFVRTLAGLPLAGAGLQTLLAQGAIQVTPLADKLHLLTGAGGNIAIFEGPDGLLLVDSGVPDAIEGILGATGRIGNAKIVRLINTHWHFDHTGGNTRIGKSGAKILAHERVKARLSSKQTNEFMKRTFDPLPPEGLPVETLADSGKLAHGGESLSYRHLPPAHTDGDTVIHFEHANILHTGDLVFNGFYPFIDYSSGGSLPGIASDAQTILKMIDGSTKVIPGHGPMASKSDVQAYADMLGDCSQIMSKVIRSGKSLEEVQAARPFAGYDQKWGNGFLKPEQWIAMNYQGMTGRKS